MTSHDQNTVDRVRRLLTGRVLVRITDREHVGLVEVGKMQADTFCSAVTYSNRSVALVFRDLAPRLTNWMKVISLEHLPDMKRTKSVRTKIIE